MPSLIQTILALLQGNPSGITEFHILKALEDHAGFSDLVKEGQLALFQKHFMVMNALYQLQQQIWDEEQRVLEISPLLIQLHQPDPQQHTNHPVQPESPALREYYLDWQNFRGTTENNVLELLNSFWRRFVSADDRIAALEVMQLDADASHAEITRRYRELAAQHHPDRGGEQETFIRIRQAYEMLGKHFP